LRRLNEEKQDRYEVGPMVEQMFVFSM